MNEPLRTIPLNKAADIFSVHPRTILRAIISTDPGANEEEKKNPYWADDHNPKVYLTDIAIAFGCKENILVRMIEGRDSLITPKEAASILGIGTRSLRRQRPRCLKCRGTVRFERSVVITLSFKG